MNHWWEKDMSGCGLSGIINTDGKRISGEVIRKSIALQHDRGNGQGGGFAAYGIYPKYKDYYALHIMYTEEPGKPTRDLAQARVETEAYLGGIVEVKMGEEIPVKLTDKINIHPLLNRYFVKVRPDKLAELGKDATEDDFIVKVVMHINDKINNAFVFSSGKNMGAFKGVGFPEDVADFYRLEEYEGYTWTAHNRFPTNTQGWWGGAHPFTLLDWSIVHNGEISSYGINKRYLEMFGYKMSLLTDTEVVTYVFDLLVRRQGLPIEVACKAAAASFWKDIDRMDEEEKKAMTALRMVYGSALLNGPFAILFGHGRGLIGMNDRIKLRPFVAATKGKTVYMASEESAIREICPDPEKVWNPRAGHPVVVELEKGVA
ncbi:MAG: glutamine amidotransferase family protein [Nitrospirae bacterium]|nr:glutamine amidotransferase family protein [Nitrospirota bacterium]